MKIRVILYPPFIHSGSLVVFSLVTPSDPNFTPIPERSFYRNGRDSGSDLLLVGMNTVLDILTVLLDSRASPFSRDRRTSRTRQRMWSTDNLIRIITLIVFTRAGSCQITPGTRSTKRGRSLFFSKGRKRIFFTSSKPFPHTPRLTTLPRLPFTTPHAPHTHTRTY